MTVDRYGERDFQRLRQEGLTLPSNPLTRAGATRNIMAQPRSGDLQGDFSRFVESRSRLRLDQSRWSQQSTEGVSDREAREIERMGMRRSANLGVGGGMGSAQLAWPKERDPFRYWAEKSEWFKPGEEGEELLKLRSWCRLLYATHPLIPSLIDIYTRFPLLDIEFKHKDTQLAGWFESLFMDELHYMEHLYDMGREHWVVGEALSMASWHDGIGAWEADEIINPNDVEIARHPSLRTNQFRVKVPEEIRQLVMTRQPANEYALLIQMYPDAVKWAMDDTAIPVSDVLMKQIKFKTDPWSRHGTPILLRAFRTLMREESLNSAQDAVADRFYSPLILARLGLDAVDSEGPWIPDGSALDALRNDLNLALMSDMRLMVHHHGLDIKSVFGREQMPKLDTDFDRVDRQLMGVFGIGEELLRGGKSNSPYASGALNRELITQMLETYQVYVRRFMKERMEPIAERQGFYEYRKAGDRRIPIMETVLVQDEETGEEYVEERPKLAIPEVMFKAMNLRDEKVERDFMKQLKDMGFPISNQSLAVNVPIEFDVELERSAEEKILKVMAEQKFKRDLFQRLDSQNLPIPLEYKDEYAAWKADPGAIQQANPQGQIDDITSDAPTPNVAPGEDAMEVVPEELQQGDETDPEGGGETPDISDEQRKTMPKKSSIDEYDPEDSILNPRTAAAIEEELTFAEPEKPAVYGGRMMFGTPLEMKRRRKMTLPGGIRIATPDEAAAFDVHGDVERIQFEIEEREAKAEKDRLAAEDVIGTDLGEAWSDDLDSDDDD